jgi:hypothetical protein
MRAIEKEMLDAIAECKSKRIGNTEVVHGTVAGDECLDEFDYADIFLHGHSIATVYHPSTSEEYLSVDIKTLRAYPTRTTMSRLRALGVDVCTRKGEVYLHGMPLDRY